MSAARSAAGEGCGDGFHHRLLDSPRDPTDWWRGSPDLREDARLRPLRSLPSGLPGLRERSARIPRAPWAGIQRPRFARRTASGERRSGGRPLRVSGLPRLRDRLSGGGGSRRHRRGSARLAQRGAGRTAPGAGVETVCARDGGGPARGVESGDVAVAPGGEARSSPPCPSGAGAGAPEARGARAAAAGCSSPGSSTAADPFDGGHPRDSGPFPGMRRAAPSSGDEPGGAGGALEERLGSGDSGGAGVLWGAPYSRRASGSGAPAGSAKHERVSGRFAGGDDGRGVRRGAIRVRRAARKQRAR